MKPNHRYAIVVVFAFLVVASTAVWGQPSSPQRVEISFAGRLEGKPFACGAQYEGVGTKKSTVTPQDLRFFVSEVELVDANGKGVPVALDQDGIWQYKSAALIDLEDGTGACRNGNAATHAAVTGSVPDGHYTGLRFTVGVPFELNHGDTLSAPSPLNMTAMFWSWQGGYKFIRAEVALVTNVAEAAKRSPRSAVQKAGVHTDAPADPTRSSGFPVHLGSTGCASAAPSAAPPTECKHPNRVVVTLPEFDPAKEIVIFDLGKLLADSDVSTNAPNTAPGCMSAENDPDCVPIMRALGLPLRGSPAGTQEVFYREAK